MSRMSSLSSFTPREAIADAVSRGLLGFDKNDFEIFKTSMAGEDVIFELRTGEGESVVYNGLSNVRTSLLDHVGPMDTTHMASNFRIDVEEGAKVASLTCYFLAQHCPPGRGKEPGGPKYLVGGDYFIDLVKDDIDGMWKIKKWVLEVVWTQGDPSVMARS